MALVYWVKGIKCGIAACKPSKGLLRWENGFHGFHYLRYCSWNWSANYYYTTRKFQCNNPWHNQSRAPALRFQAWLPILCMKGGACSDVETGPVPSFGAIWHNIDRPQTHGDSFPRATIAVHVVRWVYDYGRAGRANGRAKAAHGQQLQSNHNHQCFFLWSIGKKRFSLEHRTFQPNPCTSQP
jgi:hypothetical protein